MSLTSDIFTFWSGNTTLTATVPYNKVWQSQTPEGTAFPYVVIVPISVSNESTTGNPYYAVLKFQISLFDTNPDNIEAKLNTICSQFDRVKIATGAMDCIRVNGPITLPDVTTPYKVWQGVIEYDYYKYLVLPAT